MSARLTCDKLAQPMADPQARPHRARLAGVLGLLSTRPPATEGTPLPPHPAVAGTARFARDPAEYRPVQLTLIPGGKDGSR